MVRRGSFGKVSSEAATALAMVLTELLQNAVEHGYPEADHDSVIKVAPRRRSTRLLVRVEDQGIGLPDGFDPATSSTLGLSIVRTLVESELGGTFSLGPLPGGRGTRAELDLPLS